MSGDGGPLPNNPFGRRRIPKSPPRSEGAPADRFPAPPVRHIPPGQVPNSLAGDCGGGDATPSAAALSDYSNPNVND